LKDAAYDTRFEGDDGDTERRHFSSLPGNQSFSSSSKPAGKAEEGRHSYLLETTHQALQIRNRAIGEAEEEEKKAVGQYQASGLVEQEDSQIIQGTGGEAVYVENTRLHTDGADDGMVEEDLGLDDSQSARRMSGFGSHPRMNVASIKASLPLLKINVPLSISTHDVFDIFQVVSGKEKFQIIELEQTIATAVNKEPFSLRKMFLKCLPFADGGRAMSGSAPISAVRLQIMINDVKGCRKIILKGLYGDSDLLKTFISQFRQRLQSLVKREGVQDGPRGQQRGQGRARAGGQAS